MTTIAYNHKDKEIAVDSRVTRGTGICTDQKNKIKEIGDGLKLIFAGSSGDIELAASSYPESPCRNVDCYGFAVECGVVKWVSYPDGRIDITTCDYNESAGSGQDYAIAAMDFGKSAKEAVEYAMTRDNATGGDVRVIKI